MTDSKEAAIRARSLRREFAKNRGVCGVDVEVGWGECYALLGRNGSGKSTLTRLLLGSERADSGTLEVAGVDLVKRRRGHRTALLGRLGVAPDSSVHWPKLSGRRNAWFVAASYGLPADVIETRLQGLFEMTDLADQADSPVSEYSFGMRRKLSLVEALCHDPAILVLDEPTSGVDAQFCDRLTTLIEERSRRGASTWVAANDPDWVARTANRVAFLDKGRIVAEGSVEELLSQVRPYQEITVVLDSEESIRAPESDQVQSFVQKNAEITILVDDQPELVPQMMSWVVTEGGVISSVEVKRPTLRDAFLLKTGEAWDS